MTTAERNRIGGGSLEPAGRLIASARRAVPRALRPRIGRFEAQYRPRRLSVPRRYMRTTAPADAPPISIVTPSLNQGGFIAATLASVALQRYPRLEYIVADGGSEDATLDVLAAYDTLIDRLELGPDGGHAAAINGSLADASGEVLGWLNSDDVLLPGALAYVGRFFAEHPEIDLVYGYRLLIDEHGDDIGFWAMAPHSGGALRWVDFVPQETAFWRRALWQRLGGVSEELDVVFDWDFFRRAEASGAGIARLPRFLGAQRQHPGQKTRVREEQSLDQQEAIRARAEGRRPAKAELRARMLPYVLRSLPYEYAHALRARLGLGRAPVPLAAASERPAELDGRAAVPLGSAPSDPRGGKEASGSVHD